MIHDSRLHAKLFSTMRSIMRPTKRHRPQGPHPETPSRGEGAPDSGEEPVEAKEIDPRSDAEIPPCHDRMSVHLWGDSPVNPSVEAEEACRGNQAARPPGSREDGTIKRHVCFPPLDD